MINVNGAIDPLTGHAHLFDELHNLLCITLFCQQSISRQWGNKVVANAESELQKTCMRAENFHVHF